MYVIAISNVVMESSQKRKNFVCAGLYCLVLFYLSLENPKDESDANHKHYFHNEKRNDLLLSLLLSPHRSIVIHILTLVMSNGMAKNRKKKEIQQSHHRI